MSLEQDLKETFERHADDVANARAAWQPVERRIVRAHRHRLAAVSAFAIAVAAGAALAVPKLLDDATPSHGFFGPGGTPSVSSPDPTSSPDPPPMPPTFIYRDEDLLYQLDYPQSWQTGYFEGAAEFRPKGLPSLPVGEPTFAVEITSYDTATETGTATEVTYVGGRKAMRYETTAASGEHRVVYAIDWPSGKLRATILGSNEELWQTYSDTGEAIVRGIIEATDFSVYEHATVVTRWGTVGQGVTYNALTIDLVRFLNARCEGSGAEEFLSENAAKQYSAREGEFGLYGYNYAQQPWAGYEIRTLPYEDANSAEAEVLMKLRGPAVPVETIAMGPGTNAGGSQRRAVVRFTRIGGFE